MKGEKISEDIRKRLPEDCYIHSISDNSLCGRKEDHEICFVHYGEHIPMSMKEAEAWKDAFSEFVE